MVLSGIVAAASEYTLNLTLSKQGNIWSWGSNFYGQLGDGTTKDHSKPTRICEGVVAITAGYFHSLTLTLEGGVLSWGANSDGELGAADPFNRSQPGKVAIVHHKNRLTPFNKGSGKTVAYTKLDQALRDLAKLDLSL